LGDHSGRVTCRRRRIDLYLVMPGLIRHPPSFGVARRWTPDQVG
jgi:hypothetical protein